MRIGDLVEKASEQVDERLHERALRILSGHVEKIRTLKLQLKEEEEDLLEKIKDVDVEDLLKLQGDRFHGQHVNGRTLLSLLN